MNPKLRQRVITAILFGLVFIPMLAYDKGTAQLLFIIMLILMQFEYGKIVFAGHEGAFPMILSGLFVSIFPTVWFLWNGDPFGWTSAILLICLIFLLINTVLLLMKKAVLISLKPYFLQGLLYLGLPIYLLSIMLNEIVELNQLIFGVFILIWVADSAAYFVGSKYGRVKLFESVSPNKTWEGTLGALPFSLLAAWAVSYFLVQITLVDWILIGLIVWIAGGIGDLIESSFKRHFRIKDSGNILPGHGGFLDRFDSFIFVLPFVLAYLKYFT
jgi:phosphatidate cytidylyltransferase